MIYYRSPNNNPFGFIQILVGLIIFFTLLYIGFYIAKGVLIGLAFAAPIFLIAAFILNFGTVKNFGKYLIKLIRIKPIMGIGLALLSLLAFPVTCLVLFLRARSQWAKRREREDDATSDGSEYIDYVELEEERKNFDSIKNYQ